MSTRTELHDSALPGVSAAVRVALSAAAGLLVGAAVWLLAEPRFAVGAGWVAACLIWLVWAWFTLRPMTPSETRAHAVREDPTRGTADVVLLLASLFSLGAVGYYLAEAANAVGAERWVLTGLGMATIAASWFVIHSTYALRYARLYYGDPEGGIDFNSDESPDYRDFLYFSFNLGMTYQVSDNNVENKEIRRTVLRHCLMAFLFGVVIVGAAINIIAGLGGWAATPA